MEQDFSPQHAHLCRRCINRQYGVNLKPRDCKYWAWQTPCAQCGNVHNIVVGLRFTGKWKMYFRRKPRFPK